MKHQTHQHLFEQMRLVFGRILDDEERAIAMSLSCNMYILHSIVS
jgi:hypothetical protein